MNVRDIEINNVIIAKSLETVIAPSANDAYYSYENGKKTDEILGYKYYVSDGVIRELTVKVPGRMRKLNARQKVKLIKPRISYVFNNGEIVVTADDILNLNNENNINEK